MYAAGVKAYILKTATRVEIRDILKRVYLGETVISGNLRDLEASFPEPEVSGETGQLTTRNQLEIVRMISEGYSQAKIAEATHTSVSNIQKSLHAIRKQFGARTNPEIVGIFIQKGLI